MPADGPVGLDPKPVARPADDCPDGGPCHYGCEGAECRRLTDAARDEQPFAARAWAYCETAKGLSCSALVGGSPCRQRATVYVWPEGEGPDENGLAPPTPDALAPGWRGSAACPAHAPGPPPAPQDPDPKILVEKLRVALHELDEVGASPPSWRWVNATEYVVDAARDLAAALRSEQGEG